MRVLGLVVASDFSDRGIALRCGSGVVILFDPKSRSIRTAAFRVMAQAARATSRSPPRHPSWPPGASIFGSAVSRSNPKKIGRAGARRSTSATPPAMCWNCAADVMGRHVGLAVSDKVAANN